jgi:hypothetical protein
LRTSRTCFNEAPCSVALGLVKHVLQVADREASYAAECVGLCGTGEGRQVVHCPCGPVVIQLVATRTQKRAVIQKRRSALTPGVLRKKEIHVISYAIAEVMADGAHTI